MCTKKLKLFVAWEKKKEGTKLKQPGKRGAGGPDLIKHKKNAPNENFKRCHKPDEFY